MNLRSSGVYNSSLMQKPIQMTADEALVDFVENKLTKQQYLSIRSSLKRKKFDAYPGYKEILEAKARCYPSNIIITENSAEIKLQSLLNHTCDRLLTVQSKVINKHEPRSVQNLCLLCKLGCDGSSGQSEYKFTDENKADTVFLTSLVPLQIVGFNAAENKDLIIWKNPTPSSERFCRPIRIQFLKEDVNSIVNGKKYISDQISALVPFSTVINGVEIRVRFELIFTMIDMEVCNAETDTKSAMRCHLCQSTSSEFNNLKLMKDKQDDKFILQYGLSTLRAWNCFFEYFLHIGYKSGFKKNLETRKLVIQNGFKTQLSLIVDKPNVEFSDLNDYNTARRFFENYPISAQILGVNENLLKRVYTILQVLSSGFAVNVDVFQQYCFDTAEICVSLYPWYCMSTTVHKILIHSVTIIEWSPLPIGKILKDAQEARNKEIREFQEQSSRESLRTATMQVVLNRLLVTSDPFISSMGKNHPKYKKDLSPEAVQLLIGSEIEIYGIDSSVLSSTDDDESTDTEGD